MPMTTRPRVDQPLAAAEAQAGDLPEAEREEIKAWAAATDNVGLFFGEDIFLAIGSILLMMGSMLLFTREIQIANTALDVHLSDLESHQEWEQYLKPKRRRRAAPKS